MDYGGLTRSACRTLRTGYIVKVVGADTENFCFVLRDSTLNPFFYCFVVWVVL